MDDKEAYLRRLRRIEGQARGLQRMVDDETYCIDILTQISAMTKALESVALGLLDDHLTHCVVDAAAAGGPTAERKIKEASEAIARQRPRKDPFLRGRATSCGVYAAGSGPSPQQAAPRRADPLLVRS